MKLGYNPVKNKKRRKILKATIAVLSSEEDAASISAILGREYDVVRLGRFAEISRCGASIVLCGADTRTGQSWRELLEQLGALGAELQVIICSRNADDRLWAEALNLGAFDVLAKPFDRHEVARVIGHAAARTPCLELAAV